MKNKKAALELSVNAIVILIIAITMLALGLGFIRTLFGGATTKFTALIDQESDPQMPDSSNVITLSRGMVITSPKSAEVIKISVFNPMAADWTGGVCGGTVKACSAITGATAQTNCMSQRGCRWDTSTTACVDNSAAAACDTFYDEVSCTGQLDCLWTVGTGGVKPSIKCSTLTGLTVPAGFTVNTKTIKQGGYATFDVLFTIDKSTGQGTIDLCEVTIQGYSKDFTISVK